MGDPKKIHWTRTKTHEHAHLDAGKGLPESVSKSLRKLLKRAPRLSRGLRASLSRSASGSRLNEWGSFIRRSFLLSPKSVITRLSGILDLEEYEFPDDDDIIDPSKVDGKLDVTALDRYNDDIRRIRKMTIDECRALPHKGETDETALTKLKLIIRSLCRTSYYGTHKAQTLAEGAVILVVWLLNRKNIKATFKVHMLQSFAEMVWTSAELKLALYKCRGMRVLAKLLASGISRRSEQARWACYTLAMACIGSSEIIEAIQEIEHFEEVVGEIAFNAYWVNWPANFGSILQGILYGPYSVVPTEEVCDFT